MALRRAVAAAVVVVAVVAAAVVAQQPLLSLEPCEHARRRRSVGALSSRRVLWLATGTSFRRFAVSSWKGWRDTPP